MAANSKDGFFSVRTLTLCPVFAVLLAVCSWITVPSAVPFTMQTFAVFLIAALLGTRRGLVTVALYMCLGAIGVPVFSGFGGGVGVLFGATGGYILGFLISVPVISFISKKTRTVFGSVLAMLAGLCLCYIAGTLWFVLIYTKNGGNIGFAGAFMTCVVPYIIPDTVKAVLAAFTAKRLKKLIEFRR